MSTNKDLGGVLNGIKNGNALVSLLLYSSIFEQIRSHLQIALPFQYQAKNISKIITP